MSETLPSEIEVATGPDGVTTYDFPPRKLGNWRWFGLIPIGFGIGVISFVTVWTIGFVGGLIQLLGPWGGLSALFAFPFLVGGLSAMGIGFAVLMGRARLCVTDRQLISIEKVGWFSWKRRIIRSVITRLQVQAGLSGKVNGEPREFAASKEFAVLTAELTGGKSRLLVPGYPREWLVALANELSKILTVDMETIEAPAHVVPVSVIDAATADNGEIERLEQPAESLIDHQVLPDGCVFTIPAPGVWKGSGGLFAFSLLWCGFMTLFTTLEILAPKPGNAGAQSDEWMMLVFTGLFWIIGIGVMLAALNMGKRQAAIAVANGQMKTIVSGLFGIDRKEWALTDLKTIRKGPSGMEVNERPVMQLQIVPQTGKHYGLLTAREDAELEWIATHLRRHVQGETEITPNEEPPE